MKRDPHLPSPEICDWLLRQAWSAPPEVTVSGKSYKSVSHDCCATTAIGTNEYINLLLSGSGLAVLLDDAVARETGKYKTEEGPARRADCIDEDQQLVIDINRVIESSNVSATAAVGACAMVAIVLTGAVYGGGSNGT
jgi:hypothetical protein